LDSNNFGGINIGGFCTLRHLPYINKIIFRLFIINFILFVLNVIMLANFNKKHFSRLFLII